MDKQDIHLEKIFAIWDRDRSGYIEKANVIAIIRSMSWAINAEEAEAEIAKSDTNNDGKISKEEFIAAVQSSSFWMAQFRSYTEEEGKKLS